MPFLLLIYWLLTLVTLAVFGFALWKGGPPERWGAIVILGFVIAERLCRLVTPPDFHSVLGLVGDAATALGLLVLATRFASLWLGGAMLFYASTFILHSFYLVTGRPDTDPFHYWMNNVNFAGIHICLVAGTIIGWRRRARSRAARAPAMPHGVLAA